MVNYQDDAAMRFSFSEMGDVRWNVFEDSVEIRMNDASLT